MLLNRYQVLQPDNQGSTVIRTSSEIRYQFIFRPDTRIAVGILNETTAVVKQIINCKSETYFFADFLGKAQVYHMPWHFIN